jgi:hypothetical protein
MQSFYTSGNLYQLLYELDGALIFLASPFSFQEAVVNSATRRSGDDHRTHNLIDRLY